MSPEDEIDDQEPWVNRLKLNVSHEKGSFTFHTFPDTGSAATLIATDLAQSNDVQASNPSYHKYVNVSGGSCANYWNRTLSGLVLLIIV